VIELKNLDTEKRNARTMHIDEMSTLDMLTVINEEDHKVAEAVREVLPEIARAVDAVYEKLRVGGRLIYCGAGTSGRLGVLDAVECPPTYGVDFGMVVGLIAGGEGAMFKAVEGAEDNRELGQQDMEKIDLSDRDILVGIAASGRTPYVIGAMDYARSIGVTTVCMVCSRNSEMSRHADICIAPIPGPEVITGSSRMKSGSAQKMVLNMISTGAMIKLGKVYGNLMVDVKCSNQKLQQRAVNIVCEATGADADVARQTLEASGFSCKTAIVMLLLGVDAETARSALSHADGHISGAISARQEG